MQVNSKNSRREKNGPFSLRVLNPVGILQFSPLSPAQRLKDLKNRKIGLYWNHKARGNIALDRVRELLSKRYEGMTFEWFETAQSVAVEASKEWFDNIKKSGVEGVVASTGD
jgi:hypothetical protein